MDTTGRPIYNVSEKLFDILDTSVRSQSELHSGAGQGDLKPSSIVS